MSSALGRDVKRRQNLEAETEAEARARGQFIEVEAMTYGKLQQ